MMNCSISKNFRRRGLTLIEVVAGLALLGTLLASMLTAKGRYTSQAIYAQRVMAAVDVLDKFLVEQWSMLESMEDASSGVFSNDQDLMWRTSIVESESAKNWQCRIIRIEVRDFRGEVDEPPLVSIDLLRPDLPEENEQAEVSPYDQEELLNDQQPSDVGDLDSGSYNHLDSRGHDAPIHGELPQ